MPSETEKISDAMSAIHMAPIRKQQLPTTMFADLQILLIAVVVAADADPLSLVVVFMIANSNGNARACEFLINATSSCRYIFMCQIGTTLNFQ
jgi:hypothetical protein